MKVSTFVKRCAQEYVDQYRVVVWYDGEGVFGPLAAKLELRDCVVVSATESRLVARRQADEAFLQLTQDGGGSAPALLIYVPQARGVEEAERVADMFECFAVAGTAFGDQESEQLQSLARQAMPQAEDQIDRLFAEGQPTLRTLDGLEKSSRYPLLKEALGTEAAVDVGATLLADESAPERVEAVEGAHGELLRLLQAEFGFDTSDGANMLELRASFTRFALLSELAVGLGGELPAALAGSWVATGEHGEAVAEVCARARSYTALRESYARVADDVEDEMKLASVLADRPCVWSVDTFGCQSDLALGCAAALLEADQVTPSRDILDARIDSVWLADAERRLLWRVLERCLDFSGSVGDVLAPLPAKDAGVNAWFSAYGSDTGLWRLDRLQRLVEQTYAECINAQPLDGAVRACRARYREALERIQGGFLPAVERDGWPPPDAARATQSYATAVAPALERRERVAYFLVDALRYEMARDLAEGLRSLGQVHITPVAAALPTTTPVGMAALMPAADGALHLEKVRDEAVPAIGDRALPGSADRMSYMKALLGDRFEDVTLSELLSMTENKATARFMAREILAVRTQDIDELGEGTNLLLARDMMSSVLIHVRKATDVLAKIGFSRFVYAADHGHVLLPEIPPGDVVAAPAGAWLLAKRRCRLGSAQTSAPGTLAMTTSHVGIVTDAPDFVVPTGMRVFTAGGGYFHEGISLQECVLPLLVLDASATPTAAGQGDVHLSYRSDKFSSRVIGVKLAYMNLLEPHLDVRVEAFDGHGAKAKVVGHAADCDARDAATGLIHLVNGEEVQVPVLVEGSFDGDLVEVRVIDPTTGRELDTLALKNDMMD